MKSLKNLTLPVLSSIASMVVAAGLGAAPIAAYASPDDGVRCPTGFNAQFGNGTLKCVKQVTTPIDNGDRTACPNDTPFSAFQRMARNQRDICHVANITIPSDSDLSNFENGQLVITIPPGRQLPIGLPGNKVTRLTSGAQVVRLNENADFIFFDRSKTAEAKAAAIRIAQKIVAARQLNVSNNDVESKVAGITTQVDGLGSLDRVDVKVDLFTFAKP